MSEPARLGAVLAVAAIEGELGRLRTVFRGYGVGIFHTALGAPQGLEKARGENLDLIVMDADGADWDVFALVRAIRADAEALAREAVVVLTSGAPSSSAVRNARDCGFNHVLVKPMSAELMLTRLLRVIERKRPFIIAEGYVGPDRRFANLGPPFGTAGRRKDDLPPEVGEAKEPNMSQAEIDSLFKPQKIQL